MDQPQDETVRIQIRDALRARCNDSFLDIQWNPQSYITSPGRFDAHGLPVPPRREGRWEVIRNLEDGQSILVYQVREEGTEAYRALGGWLVDFMVRWDRANVHWMKEQKRLLEDELRAEQHELEQGEGEQQEAIERFAVDKLGMKTWIGRGADFATR